jgi:hypothetical protein
MGDQLAKCQLHEQEAIQSAQKELVEAYEEYIKLIGDEIQDLAGLAIAHGYNSTRGEAGKKCREKIANLKQEYGEMKVFTGSVPENKFDDPKWAGNITRLEGLKAGYKYGCQDILSQCKEVDLDDDNLYQQIVRDIEYCSGCDAFLAKTILKSIEQFIQEQMMESK